MWATTPRRYQRRARTEQVFRPPGQKGKVLNNQNNAKSRNKLEQLRRLVDAAQDRHFDHHTDQPPGQRRQQDRNPETGETAADGIDHRVTDIGSEHIERAMREVHNSGDTENNRQTGSNQKQGRCICQAGQELDNIKTHGQKSCLSKSENEGL